MTFAPAKAGDKLPAPIFPIPAAKKPTGLSLGPTATSGRVGAEPHAVACRDHLTDVVRLMRE